MSEKSSIADLRIRLEGRVEVVEALTRRWQRATVALESPEWSDAPNVATWSSMISLSEEEREASWAIASHDELLSVRGHSRWPSEKPSLPRKGIWLRWA